MSEPADVGAALAPLALSMNDVLVTLSHSTEFKLDLEQHQKMAQDLGD
jgi:hypothetical protein